ncbi:MULTISPECIES: hypothetical protein [unclassified Tenacibaculum]|nr:MULTISPECIES: hypothetical protein [unclassified Tenacibaculum]MCF2874049.1 hypothetical protein [Tenacibaculum sp. Cn5-1]MCF2934631.1 hypothetical protein [Tenacibaculum sp. Cn5-34]MCG7510841.1 hypothetical protein [Tenacibaculum sp. Cn5-46]
MIKLELRTDGDWEVWQSGGLQHYGSLESCGRYITSNSEELEEWENQ